MGDRIDPTRNGWQRCLLGDLLQLPVSGHSPNAGDRPASPDERGVLKLSSVADGRFKPAENKVVPPSQYADLKVPICADSLLVSRSNAPQLVGAVAFVAEDHPYLYLPDLLWLVKARDPGNIDLRWLAIALASPIYRPEIVRRAAGTSASMKKLNKESFMKIPIDVPALAEQRATATILETWEQAIDQMARLVQANRQYKAGLAQRLLAGSPGASWPMAELGCFLKPAPRPVPRPDTAYRAIGLRSHGKGTFAKPVEDPESVMMDTLFEVRSNDLVVSITFAWEGAIAVAGEQDHGALVSHRFPTYTFDRGIVLHEYFRHVIQARRFVHHLKLISPGGAGRNRVMSKTDFLTIPARIPPLEEQQKIAGALNSLDREVFLLEAQLSAIRAQKQALMQKLLTGQVRVQASGEVGAARLPREAHPDNHSQIA